MQYFGSLKRVHLENANKHRERIPQFGGGDMKTATISQENGFGLPRLL
jgi:hypothetical protein